MDNSESTLDKCSPLQHLLNDLKSAKMDVEVKYSGNFRKYYFSCQKNYLSIQIREYMCIN
jgi:hypothetical protein